MGKTASDGMNACAVLGTAFASGCAPEGAAPTELDAAPGVSKTPQSRNANVEAIITAITQRFPQAFGRKQ
jgi:hypothetical protein